VHLEGISPKNFRWNLGGSESKRDLQIGKEQLAAVLSRQLFNAALQDRQQYSSQRMRTARIIHRSAWARRERSAWGPVT